MLFRQTFSLLTLFLTSKDIQSFTAPTRSTCRNDSYELSSTSESSSLLKQLSKVTTVLQAKKKNNNNNQDSGKGFGISSSKSNIKVRQTYGISQKPIDALIDNQSAMQDFFSSKEEWHPLFASIASSENEPALDFLPNELWGQELLYSEKTPWQKLPHVPTGDEKEELMDAIAKVLDYSQQALLDIPVDEASKEDDANDVQFLEEGRRILCLNRFQVLTSNESLLSGSVLDKHDVLFRTCWSEIIHLIKEDVPDTGSLIILPDIYDMIDLKRFTDMNVLRPLDWLGIDTSIMEVASLQRKSPCIRLLHKLKDIPSLENRDKKLQEEGEN
mmetsp:Transcript_10758/g.13603  ORF Transcript_10758/g.13603 Transcript_10758/m.13603 type:complete len:329 (-) Transcript_10758:2429-3415(-)